MDAWQVGQRVSGVAAAVLPGGEAAVRVGKRTVLARGVLPEERVELCLTGKRRGAWRGKPVQWFTESPFRVRPRCAVADVCGGCAFQHCDQAAQAQWKSAWVRRAFAPWLEDRTHWVPAGTPDGRYRRRVRWHVGQDAHGRFLGFREAASHRVVRQRSCPAVEPALVSLRRRLEAALPPGVEAVQATLLDDGMHVIWESRQPPAPVAGIKANQWWRSDRGMRPLGTVRSLHDRLPAGSCDVRLMIGPEAFVQGEFHGNRELVAQVQQWLPQGCRVIADLFCGVGNLSLPAAVASGAEVVGAELNAGSVRDAARNARSLGVKSNFICADLFGDFDPEPFVAADVLILDPPRKGCRKVCGMLPRLLPETVILVSCDSAAGRRDAALLHEAGYRLRALRAFDLFPWAGHVEAMSLWVRG